MAKSKLAKFIMSEQFNQAVRRASRTVAHERSVENAMSRSTRIMPPAQPDTQPNAYWDMIRNYPKS